MADISLTDAKAHLSNLVDRALGGETVRITRRGKPVVQIELLDRQPAPIVLASLRALTDAMPLQPKPATTWVRQERDAACY